MSEHTELSDEGPETPAPLATVEDFEKRHGALTESEQTLVTELLADVSALIEAELDEVPASWFEGDPVIPSVVKAICIQVAYRAWSNPDALSSEQLGQHTQAWADRSGQPIHLTAAELRVVERAAGSDGFVSLALESPYAGPPLESDLTE
jgi:hypothetical protein